MGQTLRAVSMTSPTLMSHAPGTLLHAAAVFCGSVACIRAPVGSDKCNPNIMIHRFKNNVFHVDSGDELD